MTIRRQALGWGLVGCLLLAGVAPAAPDDIAGSATLTLVEAIAAARSDSPLLRAADRRSEAARRAAEAVRAARIGRLDGHLGYTHYQDDIIVRPISHDLVLQGFEQFPFDRDQVVAGVRLSVPIYTGGRLSADVDAAEAGSHSAEESERDTEDEVLSAVRILYARAQVAAGQLAAVDGQIRALESRVVRLARQVDVGRTAPVELRRVEADLAWSRNLRLQLTARQDGYMGDLLAVIGRDPMLEDPRHLDPLDGPMPSLREAPESLRARVLGSPRINALEAAGEVAQHRVDRARAESLPWLSLGGSLMSHVGLGLGESFGTWDLGLQMSIPLFDGGGRRARQTEAQLRAEELSALTDKAKYEALAALRGALAHWDAAVSRMEAARERLDAERSVEEVERLRAETGSGTVQDLLDAEADRLAAESDLVSARGDVYIAAAELNRIAGAEVVR